MSTATKEGVEKGDTEDANIPTSNMGYEDDTMSDAGGNIAPFTASPKNETSPPTQGIVTASTGQDSDADNLEPIYASGFGITGRLPISATSEMSTKELIAELESKLEAIVLSKARNTTVATDAVAINTGPSLATSASDQAQINSNTESPIQFKNVDTFADCLVSPKDETSKDEESIFEGGCIASLHYIWMKRVILMETHSSLDLRQFLKTLPLPNPMRQPVGLPQHSICHLLLPLVQN